MTYLFNPHSELHIHYFNLNTEKLERYYTENSEGQEWRKSLQSGDKVDVRVKILNKLPVRGNRHVE